MFLFSFISVLFIIFALAMTVRALSTQKPELDLTETFKKSDSEQRLLEVEQDINNGLLTSADAEHVITEIKRQTNTDVNQNMPINSTAKHRPTIIGLSLFIPLFVALTYPLLGRYDLIINTPERINPNTAIAAEQIEQMVQGLEQRLNDNPDDLDGWLMFYRSNMALQRYDKAILSAKKLIEIEGETADSLLRHVDALAMKNNQQLTGEPSKIIEQVLTIEPDNTSAIWLAGMSARQEGDLQTTLDYWNRLLTALEPNSDELDQVQSMIKEIELQIDSANYPVAAGEIIISVDIDEELKTEIKDSAQLYIYARSQDDKSTPIAGLVSSVSDWPLMISMSSEHVLDQTLSITDFPNIQLIARISNEAQNKPMNGDLIGVRSIETKNTNAPIYLLINERINF